MTQQANENQPSGQEATPPSPGSPEHRAAMIAAYDAQFKINEPAAKPEAEQQSGAAKPEAEQKPNVDPNAPAPRLTDKPGEGAEAKPTEGGAEPALHEQFDTIMKGLGQEKLDEGVTKALEKAGFKPEQIQAMNERFRGLLALEATQLTASLHKAAGGQEQFNALVAWGQKNLSPEQREFFDAQLNGPNAADTIALLKQRMTANSEPQLHNVNAGGGKGVEGFRDKSEMIAAMSDPRYKSSEAFRREVGQKLAVSKF